MRIILFFLALLFQGICVAEELNSLNIEFFNKFNDNYLPKYIQKALENNHTLKEANYRLNRFRWEIKKAYSYELPELSASPAYFGVHFPKNDYNIFLKNNAFILPLKTSFEADFLLKNYDKIKKSKTNYNSQIANKNNTYISLISDIAGTYINILLYDYLIKRHEDILKNSNNILNKENAKYNFGINNKEDINKSQKTLADKQTEFNDLIKKRKTALFDFCNLLGESADNFEDILRGDLENFEYTESIPEIISSDLIYLRPDMVEAENKLRSAKIDITIAKKEFFPKFDITGLFVFDTLGIGNFFSWNSSFAFLLASATQDIFQGGRKIANLKIKKEKFNELMEEYKEKDLVAIKEVNNALNLIKQDGLSEISYKKKLDIEKNNYNMAENKLKNGIISELDYIKAKNKMLEKEKDLAINKTARLVDYISLYKALGGNL